MNEYFSAIYFGTVDAAVWKWEADGKAVEWASGRTIAFRGEILQAMETLAPEGLPPFPAVVLALAACRDLERPWNFMPVDLPISGSTYRLFTPEMESLYRHLRALPDPPSQAELKTLNEKLAAISELPSELRSGAAKTALLRAVFEGSDHRGHRSLGRMIADEFRLGVVNPAAYDDPGLVRGTKAKEAVVALAEALESFDVDSWPTRFKTGFEELPRPAQIDVESIADRVRRLMKDLKSDPELGGVARIAQQMLAAVNLPRRLDNRDELPVGGVSDIVNRGPLDRLLVSELANDDLTLAVRVATGEAMYLRREEPPRTPTGARVMLVDTSLRLWGLPRMFAAAVAMALAATTRKGDELVAFRTEGDELAPLDLSTRAGLESHMAALSPDLNPRRQLGEFFNAAESHAAHEVVVVTSEEGFLQMDFQNELTERANGPVFVATVARDGRYWLRSWTGRGGKLLREAKLELKDLMAAPKAPTPPKVAKAAKRKRDDLPLIYSVDPFPLRLPRHVPVRWLAHGAGESVLGLTTDGRILRWTSSRFGPEQVTEEVPKGARHYFETDPLGRTTLLTTHGRQSNLKMLTVLHDGELVRGEFTIAGRRLCGISYHSGVLLIVSDAAITAVDPGSGAVLDTLDNRLNVPRDLSERLIHQHGRVFIRDQIPLIAGYDGTRIVMLAGSGEDRIRANPYESALFWRDGAEAGGTLSRGFLASGWIPVWDGSRPGKAWIHGIGDASLLRISRDGNRVLINPSEIVDLKEGKSGFASEFEPGWDQVVRVPTLRHNFNSIGVNSYGCLYFHDRRGAKFYVRATDGSFEITRCAPIEGLFDKAVPAFPYPLPDVQYRLRKAEWKDGSRAVVDSRGFVTLQSSDRTLLEFSCVLSGSSMAGGWLSDGRCFGDEFFVGPSGNRVSAEEMTDLLCCFAARLEW